MNAIYSDNTSAILLLTAPLIIGDSDVSERNTLSLSEYNTVARRLKLTAVNLIFRSRIIA